MIMNVEQEVNYYRIKEAIEYLQQNFTRQPELDEVAEHVHLSPFHFQRLFSEWAGISPKRFLQYLTVDFLRKKLKETKSISEAADAAGLSSQSRVYDLFTTLEGVTPQEYKIQGAGIAIEAGYHETPFGHCFIGITARGVCWLSFHDDEVTARDAMQQHWSQSAITINQATTKEYIDRIFYPQHTGNNKLHLIVKGTNFQIKVWEALLNIPTGGVVTYQYIADQIESPKAQQAVGSAVGANHIAYLIPCHRVIRKDGVLGEYRWDAIRKKSIIGWEMAKAEN